MVNEFHEFISLLLWQPNILDDRLGTEKDCQRLEETFLNLGFDVFIRTNIEGRHLEWEMLELARSDFWNKNQYGSLVVCILSHGSEGKVYGVDGVDVEIRTLKYLFNSRNCPGLYGKPKMFIVQACQGNMHQWIDNRQDNGSSAPNVSLSTGLLVWLCPDRGLATFPEIFHSFLYLWCRRHAIHSDGQANRS